MRMIELNKRVVLIRHWARWYLVSRGDRGEIRSLKKITPHLKRDRDHQKDYISAISESLKKSNL